MHAPDGRRPTEHVNVPLVSGDTPRAGDDPAGPASMSPSSPDPRGVLESAEAGGMAIRGGALRIGGYGLGTVLVAVASVLLLRYLGVQDFGRYVTVMSLVAIVSGMTDVGLTVVGAREYVLADHDGRRRIIANIVGIRLVATPIGVLLAVGFAAAAGYGQALVLGTLLAGFGLVLVNTAMTLTIPMSAHLRLGAVTLTELVKQSTIVAGIAALAVLEAPLLAFFAVHVSTGVAVLALTTVLVGRGSRVWPAFELPEWRRLLVESWPVAVGLVLNVLFVRVLVILCTLLVSETEVGLFATSYRILEAVIALPAIMVGAAYPILVHAAAGDADRLRYAMQRVGEVSLLAAAFCTIGFALAAEPIVVILGGAEYRDAVPVLRLQSFALLGAFMFQVWVFGLLSLQRQRALIAVNGLGLVGVLVLGLLLIPWVGAPGAALAAVIGEAILALSALVMLVRARGSLRPDFGYVPRIGLAAAIGGGVGLLVGLPDLIAATVACVVYLAVAWRLRTVPDELLEAARVGLARAVGRGA